MSTRFDCQAVASFLEAGRTVAAAGNAAALLAGLGCLLPGQLSARLVFAFVLAVWTLVCWTAIRVRIDASLFQVLAHSPDRDAERLDALIAHWTLSARSRGRSQAERSDGAIRQLRRLVAAAALQFGALIAGIVLRWLEG